MDIEIGKTYRSKTVKGRTATVLYVGDEAVFYRRVGPGESIESSTTIKLFNRFYEEIPAWKPKVGETAFYKWPCYMISNVKIIAVNDGLAWIKCTASTLDLIVPIEELYGDEV